MMQFESRVLSLPKDPDDPRRYQDASAVDEQRTVAAVADGVASAIFSGPWAKILVEATVRDTPDPADRDVFAEWLTRQREAWQREVDGSSLNMFQKAKMRDGAFSTLLALRLTEHDGQDQPTEDTYRMRCFAFGDSCLFHVRDGNTLKVFPMSTPEELEADPVVLGSIDLNRDRQLAVETLDADCRAGDLLVLCTDAVALWAMQQRDEGNPPAWEKHWEMDDDEWAQWVVGLREEGKMRFDDTTLVLLRVGGQARAYLEGEEESEESGEETSGSGVELAEESPSRPWLDQAVDRGAEISRNVGSAISKFAGRWRKGGRGKGE